MITQTGFIPASHTNGNTVNPAPMPNKGQITSEKSLPGKVRFKVAIFRRDLFKNLTSFEYTILVPTSVGQLKIGKRFLISRGL